MTTTKPMSFLSLQIVLQHMEANKRIFTAQHCPFIRKTEKSIPLKIDALNLSDTQFEINGTLYLVKTYRQYPERFEIPYLHQLENETLMEDLDVFGVPEKSRHNEITPGDIVCHYPEEPEYKKSDEYWINYYTQEIELHEGISERGHRKLQILRTQLQPYLNRRDNILPPYQIKTQVFIISPDGNERIYSFEKNMQIHEMMKHVYTSVFGNRRQSVIVKHLLLEWDVRILRLPLGLKFKVREVKTSNERLGAIEPVIDESSFPLGTCETFEYILTDNDCRMEKTAKQLNLHISMYDDTLASLIANIRNKRIKLVTNPMVTENYVFILGNVLQNWRENGRDIGSCFSYETKTHYKTFQELREILMRACEPFQGIRVEEGFVRVPLSQSSEIHVKFEVIGTEDFDGHLEVKVVASS